jgi:hypothetical protein
MHGHTYAAADAVRQPRPYRAPGLADDHRVLAMQRMAGNRAVAGLMLADPTLTLQRCGGETHAGCPCAEGGAEQATDGTGHDHH